MISIRTTAAPYLPGWMHQRRYCRPALGRCSSAAVACGVLVPQYPPPPAMWPAVGPGGRSTKEIAGPLPADRPWLYCRSVSGGKNHRISGRPRAGGGLGRGAALTGVARQRAPRRAAERRVGKTLPGTVAWLCGQDLAGFYLVSAETAHLFSCL
jgi:hypothetical protein